MPTDLWSNERLNDRFREVDRRFDSMDREVRRRFDVVDQRLGELTPMPKAVAVLATELKNISRKLDEMVGNPVAEARQSKSAIRQALLVSFISNATLVALSLLSGAVTVH